MSIRTLTTGTGDIPALAEYDYEAGEPEVRYYRGSSGQLPNGDGHPGSPECATLLHLWLEKDGKRLDIVDFIPDKDIEEIEAACLEDVHEAVRLRDECRAEDL